MAVPPCDWRDVGGKSKRRGGKMIFCYDLEMDGGRSGKRGSGSG